MTRLGIRARFALLSAALVFAIATLVGAGGYLTLRHKLLAQANDEANGQARQLVALIDVGAEGGGGGNQVDLGDPSLTGGFTRGGMLVRIVRPDGSPIQASPGAPRLPAGVLRGCVRSGQARSRTADFAVACARVGNARRPAALVAVGAPLVDARNALAGLVRALVVGVIAGTVLAGALARAVAERQRRFVADASHELRTPLATIQAHVALLRGATAETPGERAASLAALDKASRAAGRVGADLLYLAQLDRAPPQSRAATQLDQVVVDAVREAQPLRPAVPIRVARLDEARLAGDELALRQLVVNLLDNALRLSPPAGEVTVALVAHGRCATVTVGDRGPGIPLDRLERIFDRLHTTAPSGAGNAGLGLAIARDIARRHRGDLHAENRRGGGAVFMLELPLTEIAPSAP
jgi:signal transduction histidine kinase